MDIEELVWDARAARNHAYVPLSKFKVGTVVLNSREDIFEGCDNEYLIPVLGVCAERNAINHAIIHGATDIVAVAVVYRLQSWAKNRWFKFFL